MKKELLLFDMDGVLLKPGGYHQALKDSVIRIGKTLGAPGTEITSEQIAQFEALSVTNEWDTLAICAALILIHLWRVDGCIRISADLSTRNSKINLEKPDFQNYLDTFVEVGPLPGRSAYQKIIKENNWLNPEQKGHLENILFNCRDIFHSLTLPIHQETVLGSQAFEAYYGLKPQLDTESYLSKYDKPIITPDHVAMLKRWTEDRNRHAGILTNRPNTSPADYVSAPEAEMGAKLAGLEELPILGSGMLTWYAEKQCNLSPHTLLKPNPVHVLGLLQMCLGQSPITALQRAVEFWRGELNTSAWQSLHQGKVIIFEDSIKGLQSGLSAKSLLERMGIVIEIKLIGVTENTIKKKSLLTIADEVIESVNLYQWNAN